MKGIVFTEFLEMVEEKFGLEVVDSIIDESDLPSSGIYTAIGTYDFNEMVSLITSLSKTVNMEVNDLIYAFGHYLFTSLAKPTPRLFKVIIIHLVSFMQSKIIFTYMFVKYIQMLSCQLLRYSIKPTIRFQ